MNVESIPKYMLLSSLIWKLIRPFALVVARNTRNTTIDEDIIQAVDEVLGSKAVEFENEVVEKDRKRGVIS
jgi:hypothetical protein